MAAALPVASAAFGQANSATVAYLGRALPYHGEGGDKRVDATSGRCRCRQCSMDYAMHPTQAFMLTAPPHKTVAAAAADMNAYAHASAVGGPEGGGGGGGGGTMSCHQDRCSPWRERASASCTYVWLLTLSPNNIGASSPGSYAAPCRPAPAPAAAVTPLETRSKGVFCS